MNANILETKSCKQCSKDFTIYQKDQDFYDKISPSFDWKNFQIPRPTLCPDCRKQRRLSFRNDRKLYKRKCDATGKEIISVFSPDKPYRVYAPDFYWSDAWEIEMSEKDFDFERGFFEQFDELYRLVPKRALLKGTGSVNCNYASLVWASEDWYLIFNGTNSKQCLYTDGMSDVENCVDCSQIRNSSNCYEAIDVINCNRCFYIQDCLNCSFSSYLFDCINCNDCFACIWLRNKSYCIFNTQYSREEYQREKQKLVEAHFSAKDFYEFTLDFPRLDLKIVSSENATGNMIYNSQNIHDSYEVYDAQDVRYCVNIYRGAHDCMDVNVWLNNGNKLYEVSLSNKSCHNILFSHDCWNFCENLIYCSECKKTQDCFGCCWLLNKQYCILNKQYSKEEYEKIVPKIIKHMQEQWEWGEFFPMWVSPFGYNETAASEFYPSTKEEILSYAWKWSNYEAEFPKVDKIIQASKLPIDIRDIPDDILGWAIECEVSQKPFRIIEAELEFYRKHMIPIPKRHPDTRYQDRLDLRAPRALYRRSCDKCQRSISSSYSPEKPEKVYCEVCYNKEVY